MTHFLRLFYEASLAGRVCLIVSKYNRRRRKHPNMLQQKQIFVGSWMKQNCRLMEVSRWSQRLLLYHSQLQIPDPSISSSNAQTSCHQTRCFSVLEHIAQRVVWLCGIAFFLVAELDRARSLRLDEEGHQLRKGFEGSIRFVPQRMQWGAPGSADGGCPVNEDSWGR